MATVINRRGFFRVALVPFFAPLLPDVKQACATHVTLELSLDSGEFTRLIAKNIRELARYEQQQRESLICRTS